MLVLGEELGELAGGGGFARTLKADDQDDGWRFVGEAEACGVRAEDFDQLIMDDFDDLLAGGKGVEDLFSEGFFFNGFEELFDDAEMHVGFKQRHANFA